MMVVMLLFLVLVGVLLIGLCSHGDQLCLDVYKRQTYTRAVYSTIFSLLPPVIAIVLALNTKEVYTSLLVGIASGALLYRCV